MAIAEMIVRAKADVNHAGADGQTAVWAGAFCGQTARLEISLPLSANLNYPNLNISINVKYGWFILEATLA